jgi:YD repeat-containing protein
MGVPHQNANEMATYLHDGTTEVTSSGLEQGTQMMTGPDGEVLSYTDSGPIWQGATWIPLHDGQGSTIATVNSSGTVDTQYTYDPFGQTTVSGQWGLGFAPIPLQGDGTR